MCIFVSFPLSLSLLPILPLIAGCFFFQCYSNIIYAHTISFALYGRAISYTFLF